jgi:hypothetical protein
VARTAVGEGIERVADLLVALEAAVGGDGQEADVGCG